jgi:hypothetical protein
MNASHASNSRQGASAVLARRQPAAQPAPSQAATPRSPFRVLHTSGAPAQLSLFLRPVAATRR